MPRDNSLVSKVKKSLKGLVLMAKSEKDLKKELYPIVRKEIVRGGVRKDADTVAIQSDFVTETLGKEIKNLSEGGVKLSL
jgi:hypothetical protein